MAQDTISHFSHPGHELVKRHYLSPYLCDMCWEDLSGSGYGCGARCDFGIHESCAARPLKLSSPAHHAHELVLVQTRRDEELACDVCVGGCAPGSFLYRCPPCGFDMHPRCAQLPQTAVYSSLHSEHDLTLVLAEGSCAACQGQDGAPAPGRGWFYRCSACNVDLHVSCASAGDGEEAESNHVTPGDVLAGVAAVHNNIQVAQALARLRVQGGQSVAALARPSYIKERTKYF
ncbi:hypothetical protein EJB05_11323, partial [Eragrostis curvula]